MCICIHCFLLYVRKYVVKNVSIHMCIPVRCLQRSVYTCVRKVKVYMCILCLHTYIYTSAIHTYGYVCMYT